MRKVTRIILKSVLYFSAALLLLSTVLVLLARTSSFQTWLAQKVTNYLSEELHTDIKIEKVEILFFKEIHLKNIFIEDKNKDTLLSGGDLKVLLNTFDYKHQKIDINNIILSNVKTRLIINKNDSVLNFQHLIDYFTGEEKSNDTTGAKWDIIFNDLTLDNVNFIYKNENKNQKITPSLNYNNINLKNISGTFSNIKLDSGTYRCSIEKLSAQEQSGFILNNLTTNAKFGEEQLLCENLVIYTPGTSINGKLNFKYDSLSAFNDFINEVYMDIYFNEKSKVDIKDIASFAEDLQGLEDTLKISGNVKGYVSQLQLNQIDISYLKNTGFKGDLAITGLPDINNSYLHFDSKKLSTSYSDLTQIPNFPFNKGDKLKIPKELAGLGTITYSGKFDGLINDFTTYGLIKTGLGSFKTDLFVRTGKKEDDIEYSGKLETSKFNLGAYAKNSMLGTLNMKVKINGKGISINKINAKFEGVINSLTYNNYNYSKIKIDGSFANKSFNGVLVSEDPNADFDFNGTINFTNKMPQMDFISTVNNFDLQKLNFTKEKAELSTQILINLSGDNLNNLTGDINFDNTFYKNIDKTYKISTFDLKLEQEQLPKHIRLTSNYFNLDVNGAFDFTNLPLVFNQVMHAYYPTFFEKNKGKIIYQDNFTFKLTIKKFDIINELFIKSLKVSPASVISGELNASKNLVNCNLKSGLIEIGSIKFNTNTLESYSQNNKINLVFKSNFIQLTDSVRLPNYFMYFVSKDLDTKYNAEWNNNLTPNSSGQIKGRIAFKKNQATFFYDNFNITVKDTTWQLITANPTLLDSTGAIVVNPLYFINKDQSININGVISNNKTDSVNLAVNNLMLRQFNPLIEQYNLKMEGYLNGNIRLTKGADSSLTLNSFLDLTKFKFNDNLIGELVLKADYLPKEKILLLDGYTSMGLQDEFGREVKNISFNGNYNTTKKEESINIDFKANPMNLKLLNPFLTDILTIKSGFANGEGKIHGTPSNILIDGALKIFKSEIKVDYTNVSYNITGGIEIMPDQIRFSDLLMTEANLKSAPQGTINGNIFHSNFKKMQIDYDVTYRNMLLLNTTEKQNPSFYGKIYGSGNIGVWGFLNNIYMQVRDTTRKASKFILPLDGPEEISDNDFIHFVKLDTTHKEEKKPITGFNLDLNIVATPELATQIIFDRATGDAINVVGNGEIKMLINTLGKFDMVGNYIITSGDYNFSLEKVINKKFDIDAGSSIVWSGSPYNADIDIVASYRQRASIAPLINDITGEYKNRTPAYCKLKMKNKLLNPDISFALEFPSIADNVRSQINSVLTDEQELNRQVFSFLLFRSFVPPLIYNTSGGGVTAGSAAASTGSEMLSNQLSNMLGGMVGNFDKDLQVGLNYRAGSRTNSDEVLINVNKNFFDDKLTVDGNFGVGNSNTGTKNYIGDVNIEYKLSKDGRYKLKGFNRTNDNTQLITTGGLYTQGVGFFFREEFDSFSELYKRYLKKIKGDKK